MFLMLLGLGVEFEWGLVEVGALWTLGLGMVVLDDENEEGGEGGSVALGEAGVVLVVVLLE